MKLKRTVALLLTLAMLLSNVPLTGLADDAVTEPQCTCGTQDENHTAECDIILASTPSPASQPGPEVCATCGKETCECCTECKQYPAHADGCSLKPPVICTVCEQKLAECKCCAECKQYPAHADGCSLKPTEPAPTEASKPRTVLEEILDAGSVEELYANVNRVSNARTEEFEKLTVADWNQIIAKASGLSCTTEGMKEGVIAQFEAKRDGIKQEETIPEGPYDLWVGGTQVTAENMNDIMGNGTASYDPGNKTLTLDGFTYTGAGFNKDAYYSAVYAGANLGSLTIRVENTNSIRISFGENEAEDIWYTGLTAFCPTIIEGDGSLTLSVENVENDDVYPGTKSIGMYIDGALTIQDKVTLSATAGGAAQSSRGIFSTGDITIGDTAKVSVTSGEATAMTGEADSTAIATGENGVLTVEDQASVTVTAMEAKSTSGEIQPSYKAGSYGLFAGTVHLSTTGSIIATSGKGLNSIAILAASGDVRISAGTVEAQSGEAQYFSRGISANGNVTISGSAVVTATSGNSTKEGLFDANSMGIAAGNSGILTIQDHAIVNATGADCESESKVQNHNPGSFGLFADKVVITTDKTVTATGGECFMLSRGIYGITSVTIGGSARVNAKAGKVIYQNLSSSMGIAAGSAAGNHTSTGTLTIQGRATVTAAGGQAASEGINDQINNIERYLGSYGLMADSIVINTNGTVTATATDGAEETIGSRVGICTTGQLTITNGTVIATAGKTKTAGIRSQGVWAASLDVDEGYTVYTGESASNRTPLAPADFNNTTKYDYKKYAYFSKLTVYPIWVGGMQITSLNKDDIDDHLRTFLADKGITATVAGDAFYDPDTKTLTLDGFECDQFRQEKNNPNALDAFEYSAGIEAQCDLNLYIQSDSTVLNSSAYNASTNKMLSDSYGMVVTGNLNISGPGTFKVSGSEHTAGSSSSGLVVIGGTLTVDMDGKIIATGYQGNSISHGIRTTGNLVVKKGNIEAYGGLSEGGSSAGIHSNADITISGGTVTAQGGTASAANKESNGIRGKNVTLSGSANVTARAGTGGSVSGGIIAEGSILIKDNATVQAHGGEATDAAHTATSFGMNAQKTTTIQGQANVTATSAKGAVASVAIGGFEEGVNISGGTIVATSGEASTFTNGIRAGGASDLVISGGTVTATGGNSANGNSEGLHANGKITISNGTVTATADDTEEGNTFGIYAEQEVTIHNAKVTAKAGNSSTSNPAVIYAVKEDGSTTPLISTGRSIGIRTGRLDQLINYGTITISGDSEVTATGGNGSATGGISAVLNLTIKDTATLKAYSGEAKYAYANNGTMNISDSVAIAASNSNSNKIGTITVQDKAKVYAYAGNGERNSVGVFANGPVEVKDFAYLYGESAKTLGTGNNAGDEAGISSNTSLDITGGIVEAYGNAKSLTKAPSNVLPMAYAAKVGAEKEYAVWNCDRGQVLDNATYNVANRTDYALIAPAGIILDANYVDADGEDHIAKVAFSLPVVLDAGVTEMGLAMHKAWTDHLWPNRECGVTTNHTPHGAQHTDTGSVWYLVDETYTESDRITTSGNINLILGTSNTLNAKNGIAVTATDAEIESGNYSNQFTIWVQTHDADKQGVLTTHGGTGSPQACAGIGGYVASQNKEDSKNSGAITINGGKITAVGGRSCAGIGGAWPKMTGPITINNGDIDATGGWLAAGIGGGDTCGVTTITITNGRVKARGDETAAGIGCGGGAVDSNMQWNRGTIKILGGVVIATGGKWSDNQFNQAHYNGYGIGDGLNCYADHQHATKECTLHIENAVVFTNGTALAQPYTATNALYFDAETVYAADDGIYFGILETGNADDTGTVTLYESFNIPTKSVLLVDEKQTLTFATKTVGKLTKTGAIDNDGRTYVNYTGQFKESVENVYYEIVNDIRYERNNNLVPVTYSDNVAEAYLATDPACFKNPGRLEDDRWYAENGESVTVTSPKGELWFTVNVWSGTEDIAATGVTVTGDVENVKSFASMPNEPVKLIGELLEYFNLTITKDFADGVTAHADDVFLFTITDENGYEMTVKIKGQGSVTVNDIPYGEYTITEDNWNWRYTVDTVTGLNNDGKADVDHNSVTFINKLADNGDKWLDFNSAKQNIFSISEYVTN